MEKVAKEALPEFAERVLKSFANAQDKFPTKAIIVALEGNLGAGKTTFVQALAKALGVTDTVQSPTYVLMKKYQVSSSKYQNIKTLMHIDAYRFDAPEEFKTLRPDEFLSDPHNLILVEWPERLGNTLPKPDLLLKFSSEGASASERYIEVV